MTDANDILLALSDDPESVILAAMLTDALMEERDMLRSEADRHVERVQLDARDRLDMEEAVAIMSAGDGRRHMVLSAISCACFPNTQVPPYTVVLTPGDAAPVGASSAVREVAKWWLEWTVTVGARWVIATAGPAPRKRTRRR